MRIIIDTREQLPYEFQTTSVKGTLSTGDYSIFGLEDFIAIERKTLDDLIGSLCTGRQRFERELQRGKSLDYFAVIIESTLTDIVNGSYRSQMTPKSAIQSLLAFSVRYRLPLFFVDSRNYGARITECLLLKYAREMEKRTEAISESSNA